MRAGIGKSKVIFSRKDLPLQGYPKVRVIAKGFETELYARAFIFENQNTVLAIVVLECAFISHHLKAALIEKCKNSLPGLKMEMEQLMLCAQHTQSAPGGYSHYAFHNLGAGGFRQDIFNAYRDACFESLKLAWSEMSECSLHLNAGEFPENQDVAFNRSLDAYNLNADVISRTDMETHLALNRMMKQLRIGSTEPGDKGLINWFGVQANSVGTANRKVHADNRGYAAQLLENDQRTGPNFIAAFCQEAGVDVSPNYYGRAKWWPRGRYEDEFKSAYTNGFLQFEQSRQLAEDEDAQIPVSDLLDFQLMYVDMSDVTCDADFCVGDDAGKTGPAIVGVSFLEGTPPDIEGIDSVTASLLRLLIGYKKAIRKLGSNVVRQRMNELERIHYPKKWAVEVEEKRVLGYKKFNKIPPFTSLIAEITDELKRPDTSGVLKEKSWMPKIVPLQLFRIGELIIVGFPGDLSTTSGMRLRKTLLKEFEPHGVLDVIITACSNEHAGFVVTPEEYTEQAYEGSFTLFGRMTLPAYQTLFRKMAREFVQPIGKRKKFVQVKPPSA